MSITDELRECIATAVWQYENDVKTAYIPKDKLLAIADRIDAKHKAKVDEAYENGKRDECAAWLDETDGGYIKLPVDADGVPIRVGEEVVDIDYPKEPHLVDELRLDGMTWRIYMDNYMLVPFKCRHVQPDSWQLIIEDAANLVRGDNDAVMELVDRCKRLAGGA